MTLLATLAAALLALPALLVLGLLAVHVLLDVLAWPAAVRRFRALPLSPELKAAAIECFARARAAQRKTWMADASAPVVVAVALLFTPREANALPRWASRWNNNVSINGDSGGTLLPDGRWQQWRDTPEAEWPALAGLLQVTYDDPRYEGDAYYARGHHPRSYWARYVWLGWRNRASQLSVQLGADVAERPRIVAGTPSADNAAGWHLWRAGALFQWRDFEQRGGWLVGRNLGYKLGIVADSPSGTGRAAAVATGWSAKRHRPRE